MKIKYLEINHGSQPTHDHNSGLVWVNARKASHNMIFDQDARRVVGATYHIHRRIRVRSGISFVSIICEFSKIFRRQWMFLLLSTHHRVQIIRIAGIAGQ